MLSTTTPMDYFNSPKFTDRVNELLEEWHAPGLAISIVQDGKTEARGYGRASIEPDSPVTPDTLFDLASSSKSLTAASVALLVADDEQYPHIKWDTKMSSLLPEDFIMSSDAYTQEVTIEDILSHRTGLPR
jgi:CubicO group peptidase (beta-lactamase class C family)